MEGIFPDFSDQKLLSTYSVPVLMRGTANIVEEQIKDSIASSFVIPDSVTVSYEGSWGDTINQMKFYLKIIGDEVTKQVNKR